MDFRFPEKTMLQLEIQTLIRRDRIRVWRVNTKLYVLTLPKGSILARNPRMLVWLRTGTPRWGVKRSK
jgi:hypothetical protein